jgi:hypothetical protein
MRSINYTDNSEQTIHNQLLEKNCILDFLVNSNIRVYRIAIKISLLFR